MNLKKLLLTFLFVFGLLTLVACHNEHVYDQEVVDEKYLASEATCTEKAKYYKSCECGEKGTETFEAGELLAHVFDQKVVNEKYLASAATEEAKAKYYYSCKCGEKGTETFEDGEVLDHTHVFDKEVVDPKFLASAATLEAPAKYYKSCACGEKGTETFESGEKLTLSKVSEVLAGADGLYAAKGTVVAANAQSFLLAEEDALVLVYLGTDFAQDVKSGDTVTVIGNTSVYGGAKQFGKGSTYTVETGTAAYELGTPVALTAAACDAYATATEIKPLYVSLTGKLSVSSGKYFNVEVEGATIKGSIAYPADPEEVTALDGKNITVEGFVLYTSGSGQYLNILPTSVGMVKAGGEQGVVFDYKYADLETRSQILAALEKWLLNTGYSAPLYSSVAYTLFADRVTPLCSEYVPSMGFGVMYGSVSTGTCAGTPEDPAYRTWTSASPKTLNDMNYSDSVESDMLAFLLDALFVIDFNENKDGFKMYPSMATKLAEPVDYVDGKYQVIDTKGDENYLANKWLITVRQDLVFSNYKGEKVANITAADFIYKYKQLLDPKQANERADDCFFMSAYKVKNAEAYFKGEITDWNEVGIKQVDDYSFVIETENKYNSWDFHYYNSSFILGPLHQATYEATLSEKDGKTVSSYGTVAGVTDFTKTDMILYTGPYVLSYYEQDKEYRVVKNPNWKQNSAIPYTYNFDQISTVIIKDNNAAFELWEAGKLDSIAIPSDKLDEFITNPAIKRAPGATVFRLNVNALSQEGLYNQFQLTEEDWKVNPLLQTTAFRQAIFYAIDRDTITSTVDKSRQSEIIYMNNAYIMMDGTSGNIYRETEAGKSVLTMNGEGELQLAETANGFSKTLAQAKYVEALTQLVSEGVISEDEDVELTLEIALFDGSVMEKLGQFLVDQMNSIFNEQTTYPNVKLTVSYVACPGMDVYYEKQMTGKFDIGIGGISGSALDPLGYMDVFFDDPSNSLQLTWGIDTNAVEIEFDGMLWSYEGLCAAANGKTFIRNGDNGDATLYSDMIAACEELIEAVATKKQLAADDPKVVAALAGLEAATGIQDGYDKAYAAIKELLAEEDDAKVLAVLVQIAKEALLPDYATYVKGLLLEDYDYVKVNYIDKYTREVLIESGYESYVNFYETGYEAATKAGGAVDTKLAELVAALAPADYNAFIEAYNADKTELYAFYLW